MDKIKKILESDGVHYWVKDSIRTMLMKDPVDNLKNVALLKLAADIIYKEVR